jgi:DNA polymerase
MLDNAAPLKALADEIRACKACRLHEQATNAVPGSGNPNAEIMFIGEGPGYHEDKQGLPFVGQSGQYLDYLLNLINLKRETVFIANVVKHRAPDNRDPLPDEIQACCGFLDRQEQIIDPLVIVTLGRFSMARYFPNAKITAIHGKPKYEVRRVCLPLFHPAAVLRNPGLRRDMETDFKLIPVLAEEMRQKRQAATPGSGAEPPQPPAEPPTQLKLF